ncbi:MAG TPA: staygreen family protein [Bacillota bacterium]|nr:staygreen family protein [Bacillota bacterium]
MNGDERGRQNSGRLNLEKLFVEFRTGVTPTIPITNRHYTLTHSDTTAELFLTVALEYAWDKISPTRDEVLAEWRTDDQSDYLYGTVYVDGGEFSPEVTAVRNRIFRQELPLALEAIRYGDREFFRTHPELDQAPIWIFFDSTDPQYKKVEYWGEVGDYAHF